MILMPEVCLEFKKTHNGAFIPKYEHEGDSGMDLRIPDGYFKNDKMVLEAGERILINTGLQIRIPAHYEVQVRSKSGLALKQGLIVLNSPGTIEHNYQGDIGVILFNSSKNNIELVNGMKIAQIVVCPVVNSEVYNVRIQEGFEFESTSTRGIGGFGSTGVYAGMNKLTVDEPNNK